MIEKLCAITGEKIVGEVLWDRSKDQLQFIYDKAWRNDRSSFPISLSMPLRTLAHEHKPVDAFLWGLLPDNDGVLKRWGERFHVSHRHSFQLLSHVGEDCAGAIQLVRPGQVDAFLSHRNANVQWLSNDELEDRIKAVLRDHSATRFAHDRGQFSLAGAQPKIALHFDDSAKRWGIPEGAIPTTHILKPATDDLDGKAEVEHLCLGLAAKLDFRVPSTEVVNIGGIHVFVAERYDRIRTPGGVCRIHQEDMCQALSHPPHAKYQNQGGPGAVEIVSLLRSCSSRPEEDVWRFFDALALNWLIAGTDAHAKNYSLLLAGNSQVRLAPLYDLISSLPYPRVIDPRRAKLAMKIGGRYLLRGNGGITAKSWEKCAIDLSLDIEASRDRILSMAGILPDAAAETAGELRTKGLTHPVIGELVDLLAAWTSHCAKSFTEPAIDNPD